MTAFRAAFKAYRMHQVLIMVRHFSVPVAKVTGTRHAATSKYHLD